MSVVRSILAGVVIGGCAEPPPVRPVPPVTTAPVPVPAIAAGSASVWTTESNTDDCHEFADGTAPHFSTFGSRDACESWVHGRRCRPGFSCSDGCNTIFCSPDGDHLATTLVDCEVLLLEHFEFQKGATTAPASAKGTLAKIAPALQQILSDASGKIVLRSQAAPAEATTAPVRTRLGDARTRAIRDLLVAQGVPVARIETSTEPSDAQGLGRVSLSAHADAPHRECK